MNKQTHAIKDVTEAQGFLQQLQKCWKKCSPDKKAYFVQPYLILVKRVSLVITDSF
jgi:hypothetical protein